MVSANYEAEQSVIGVILMDSPKAMPLAAMKLTEDDFHVPELKSLYGACLKLFKSGKPVDAITVLSAVGDEYRETIKVAAETAPTISNFSAYADAVKERSQKPGKLWDRLIFAALGAFASGFVTLLLNGIVH